MTRPPQNELLGLNLQQLTVIAEEAGEPSYRGRQLFDALYAQRMTSLQQATTLPQAWRAALAQRFSLGLPEIEKKFVSADATVRYLLRFANGQSVETVWMPEGDGGEMGDGSEAGDEPAPAVTERAWRRATICVSSQAGCAVDCRFCMTALLALLNEQGVRPQGERLNLVFMGQGEPFLNYESFMQAVRLLVEGVGIPESRMTVSTAGIVPRIYDFAAEPMRPKLAISLNASNDELRSRLMPINHKWGLQQLMAAARDFPLRNRERLTFEYVLLNQVNDSLDNAREVVELVRGLRCKVNLIALNPGPNIPFATPEAEGVLAFQQVLQRAGIPTFLRRPRGRDIYAACGQLK